MPKYRRKIIINSFQTNSDIIAITCFFNPANFRNKKINFDRFRKRLKKQGVPLLVVECAFEKSGYTIKESDAEIIVRVRSNSRIWQKERLLNIAIEHIPEKFTKFAALDCDVLFENDDWAKKSSKLLEKFPALQPYTYSYRLEKDKFKAEPPFVKGCCDGQRNVSFCKFMFESGVRKKIPGLSYGHPGFAWCFRRDYFPGFYDKLIVEGGDAFHAYAFYGFTFLPGTYKPIFVEDQKKYIKRIYSIIKGKTSFVDGMLLHLWHGHYWKRKYHARNDILNLNNFNPNQDLRMNKYGCWEVEQKIEKEIREYFDSRKEDEG